MVVVNANKYKIGKKREILKVHFVTSSLLLLLQHCKSSHEQAQDTHTHFPHDWRKCVDFPREKDALDMLLLFNTQHDILLLVAFDLQPKTINGHALFSSKTLTNDDCHKPHGSYRFYSSANWI